MNTIHELISLLANLLLAAAISPVIFTLLTIKQNALKQQSKDCSEVKKKTLKKCYKPNIVTEVQTTRSNCVQTVLCFYAQRSYLTTVRYSDFKEIALSIHV